MGEIELPTGIQDRWAGVVSSGKDATCQCGSEITYKGAKNLEYLHSSFCPLFLDPNWLDKLNKELRDGK